MKIKEFERMLCDSLNDTIDEKMPEELASNLHFVDTMERLNIKDSKYGLKIVLNDGSTFYIEISGLKRVNM